MRYFIQLAYDGSAYSGWQIQQNSNSVQETLQKALGLLLKEDVEITGSGRTDAGVHATSQIAHFDTSADFVPRDLVVKLNSFLPNDISTDKIFPVKDDAHARFSAITRSYEYHIHQKKNPFLRERSYFFNPKLDLELMNKAADLLKNFSDFESFSKVKTEVYTFQCEILDARWEKHGDQLVFHVTANRFLRGMVRTLVGTLLEIGQGRKSLSDLQEIIESKDRRKAGRAVPANGLFLTTITYPDQIRLD
jgi:tRNA pseudouridine38-40 synthase